MTARKPRPHGFFTRESCWRVNVQDLLRESRAAKFNLGDYHGDIGPHIRFPEGVEPVELHLPFVLHRGGAGDAWLTIGFPDDAHQKWRMSFQDCTRLRRRNGGLVKKPDPTRMTVMPTLMKGERAFVHNADDSRAAAIYITPDESHVMGTAQDLQLTILVRTLNRRKRGECAFRNDSG